MSVYGRSNPALSARPVLKVVKRVKTMPDGSVVTTEERHMLDGTVQTVRTTANLTKTSVDEVTNPIVDTTVGQDASVLKSDVAKQSRSPLVLKAKSHFPPYDAGCEPIQLGQIAKKNSSGLKSSWNKFVRDMKTAPDQVSASGAVLNGYPINDAQVKWFAANFNVRIRDHTHYWYDVNSGFFGKLGGRTKCVIDPGLHNVRGGLDPTSSAGDTGIWANGRELPKEEVDLFGMGGMRLESGRKYTINAEGDVRLQYSPDGQVLFNWREKERKTKRFLFGATAVALVGGLVADGLVGSEAVGGAEGWGGSEAAGGGDNFWHSDITGAAGNVDSSGAGYVASGDGTYVSYGM